MNFKDCILIGSAILILTGCSDESDSSENNTSQETNIEENSGEINESTEGAETSEGEGKVSNSTPQDNMLDLENFEPGWINFEGELKGSPDYRVTPEISYDPASQYKLNIGAYISYFNNGEFIETVQSSSGSIDQIEGADTIRVSYHKSFTDNISLTKK